MAGLVGRTLGKYRLVARLGRGGMAEVYKAYQPGMNRYVSIKVLHSHMVEEKNFLARFEREALAIGKLRHPNIVQAFDFDREDDISYMAMEFIDGPTLKDEIEARIAANRRFSLKEIARIFTPLCSAIDYAHARQMIHRDLKPANVMLNRQGQVVLTDFGITRILGGTQYTQTGAMSGTPAYMSPEQGQGQHGDERSDIYSLGVMLYELVTGVVPFEADTPFVVIVKHINEPVPLPSRVVPDLPPSIEQIILKAMSKKPADRYQRAGELAAALREATGLAPGEEYLPLPVLAPPLQIKEIDPTLEHFPVRDKPPTGPMHPVRTTLPPLQNPATELQPAPARRSMLPLLLGGGFLVLLLVGGLAAGIFIFSRNRADTQTAQQLAASANATATAAVIHATETGAASVKATETAAVQAVEAAALNAPAQTAQAATAVAEATAAQQTREADLFTGVQQAVGATVTAVAQQAAEATAAAQQVSATETAAAEATAQAAEAEAAAANAATATANAATATAVTQATQTAQAQTEATAQTQAAQAARIQASAPKGIFNDFETASSWRRGDEPNGTFEPSTAEAYAGEYAGKLDYKFSSPNNDYVVFLWTQSLGGQPNKITAWVKGDGAGHFLNLWVKDSAGETWQFSFGQIKHEGWQQMSAFISPGQPWPAGHIDGPDNKTIDYPLSFQALVLDDGSDDFSGSGTLYIDDLAGSEGTLPPTAVPTSAAAILFRADQTTLGAGGCAVLSWSVENVSAVYLDGAPMTGQGSRQVCPNGTTTYTLHVVKRDGSSSDVPVTIMVQ